MKAGWEIKPLGEVCEFQRGLTYAKSDEVDVSNNIVLRATNIDLATNLLDLTELKCISDLVTVQSSKKVRKDSLLICTASGSKSHLGKVAYIDDDYDFAFGGFMGMLTPSECLLPRYFFHLMTSGAYKDFIAALSDGANINNLKFSDLQRFPVPIPPLPEQHRIVAILDEAFDGIATARANAEKNLHNPRALFESHLQSVFTQRGEGWIERSIGDICTLKSGTSVGVSLEKAKGEIPYVKVSDMTYAGNETEIVSSSRFLDMADVGKNAVFPAGTTIFPKRGGAILTNKKRLTALPICADLNIMGVIPSGNLHPRLLYYYFLNVDMRLIGSGSSIPQINNYDIAPLKISFPETQDEQEAILQILDNLSAETQRLESLYQRKLAALDALKQSLLHQAFSGAL